MKASPRPHSARISAQSARPSLHTGPTTEPTRSEQQARTAADGAALLADLKQRAAVSPVVQRQAEMQRMADARGQAGPILQLRRVSGDKLNVAGENHEEDIGDLSLYEGPYAHKVAGGRLWEEYAFTFGGEIGDPPQMRLIYYMKMINEQLLGIYRLLKELSAEQFTLHRLRARAAILSATGFVTKAMVLGETAQPDMEGFVEIGEIYGKLHDRLVGYGQRLGAADDPKGGGPPSQAEVLEAIGHLYNFTEQAGSHVKGGKDDARVARSKRMAKIAHAASAAGERGIWKIGQRHVPDIAGLGGEFAFDLLPKDEYLAGLTGYKNSIAAEAETALILTDDLSAPRVDGGED